MSLYKQKGSQVWWVDLRHAGHRVRRSTGHVDRAKAQEVHNAIQVELWQAVPHTVDHTWGEAVLEWCKAEPRSESELLSLRKFATHFKDRALHAVTPEAVDEALSFCVTAGTYTRYRTMIAAILALAKRRKWMAEMPVLKERKDKKKKPRKWITASQWADLYGELPKHLRPPAKFAVETGLRQANVLGLLWSKVDLERRLVWVEAEDMKADEPLAVPLSDGAVEALKAVAGQHATHVFTFRGRPIAKPKTAFNAACVRAGISDFTWHGLRHTWATWHVQNGTPLDVLQKLGGWADLRMVMLYAHHTAGHLASFANHATKRPTPL